MPHALSISGRSGSELEALHMPSQRWRTQRPRHLHHGSVNRSGGDSSDCTNSNAVGTFSLLALDHFTPPVRGASFGARTSIPLRPFDNDVSMAMGMPRSPPAEPESRRRIEQPDEGEPAVGSSEAQPTKGREELFHDRSFFSSRRDA
jgi:hypothetical protein